MASSRNIEALELIVVQFRKTLGINDVIYIDLKVVLEKMKVMFPGFTCQRVPDNDFHGAKGMYDPVTESMQIPDTVFSGMENRVPHHRLSVAHEIAHVVLNHDGLRFRHATRRAYEKADPKLWRDEREAERFAALLLAPTHLAASRNTIEDLEQTFGLSRRAAEIRKLEIEAHLRKKNGETREIPPSVIDFLNYARSKGYKVSFPVPEPKRVKLGPQRELRLPSSDSEICLGCGYLSLERVGLQLVCRNCGKRLSL